MICICFYISILWASIVDSTVFLVWPIVFFILYFHFDFWLQLIAFSIAALTSVHQRTNECSVLCLCDIFLDKTITFYLFSLSKRTIISQIFMKDKLCRFVSLYGCLRDGVYTRAHTHMHQHTHASRTYICTDFLTCIQNCV